MSQTLNKEEQCLIDEEVGILSDVLESLKQQSAKNSERLLTEQERARELTAGIVAASRDEDKAMLASDEAVAHTLRDNRDEAAKSFKSLLNNPYFARFVVEEEHNGRPTQREYRLGFSANPDCRIVDWRKAPISKIYYEYKEGDEYFEEIQGREREGTVRLRNSLQIEKQQLKSITCRYGTFQNRDGSWSKAGRQHQAGGGLKEILTLITPEQFQTITEDATTAILIQGIAGSGKTTVALHRLAWLLHEDNSDLTAENSIVIVLSDILKKYISGLLPSIDIHGVEVLTYFEWTKRVIQNNFPHHIADGEIKRNEQPPFHGISRLKNSFAFLSRFETLAIEEPALSFHEINNLILSDPKSLLALDETRLLDADLIRDTFVREQSNAQAGYLDQSDEALLIRLHQLRNEDGAHKFGHIVVDEIQDYSPLQLATLIEAVNDSRNMTLVGDTSQQIFSYDTFPGWEKLRSRWAFKDDVAKYISLTVSHRSTLPIMRLADHVQGERKVTEGKKGRVPIYFKCKNEEDGLTRIIDWLQTAVRKYPAAMTAVLCPDRQVARYAFKLLEPSFPSALRLGDKHNFSFEEGIVVSDTPQVKGLEFTNVLLWNPSTEGYPKSSYGKNLLYVAVTRAEENLAIVSWDRPSRHLPHIHSKLVRGYDFTEPEEE